MTVISSKSRASNSFAPAKPGQDQLRITPRWQSASLAPSVKAPVKRRNAAQLPFVPDFVGKAVSGDASMNGW
jgi:hypothetical protein